MILPRSRRKKHHGVCAECGRPTRIAGSRYLWRGRGEQRRKALHCPRCAAPKLLAKIDAERQAVLRKLA